MQMKLAITLSQTMLQKERVNNNRDWIFENPTIMSHLGNCFLLAQLIAKLIHYACNVALMG